MITRYLQAEIIPQITGLVRCLPAIIIIVIWKMAWFTQYLNVDTGEDLSAYRYTTIRYGDESGNEFQTPQGPAWCRNCNSIVNAEAYATELVQQRERIQIALTDPESKWAWIFRDAENADAALKELDALASFLDGRKAGPRCLECFSEDIVELADEEEGEFECPDGHRYQRNGFGHASMRVEIELRLSREGLPTK